jgi:uncharacterized phage-associated protein
MVFIFVRFEKRCPPTASIIDIAKYILRVKGECTTMKLQKLCYYSQAWTLVWDDIPLFPEDFVAWANGPVSPVLFSLYKDVFALSDGDLGDYDPAALTDRERENVGIVLKEYWPYKPFQLSELTHREDPWKIARGDVPLGQRCNCVIQKLSMQEFYSGILTMDDNR